MGLCHTINIGSSLIAALCYRDIDGVDHQDPAFQVFQQFTDGVDFGGSPALMTSRPGVLCSRGGGGGLDGSHA